MLNFRNPWNFLNFRFFWNFCDFAPYKTEPAVFDLFESKNLFSGLFTDMFTMLFLFSSHFLRKNNNFVQVFVWPRDDFSENSYFTSSLLYFGCSETLKNSFNPHYLQPRIFFHNIFFHNFPHFSQKASFKFSKCLIVDCPLLYI